MYNVETTTANGYSAHDNLIFVVYETVKAIDPVTYPNYKYVADIYIDGNLISRQKATPLPDSKRGVFNISSVVRNYLDTTLNPNVTLDAQQAGEGEFFISVQVKFGEEYSDTLYTNVNVEAEKKYYNYYKGRTTALETITNYTDKVISNKPTSSYIPLSCSYVFHPFHAVAGTITYNYQIIEYPSITTVNGTFTPSLLPRLMIHNVSPAAINAVHAGLITSTTTHYTVQLDLGTIYTYYISCGKYDSYRVHFLNQMGGFDTFNFDKVSRTNFQIDRKSYRQREYEISGAGAVSYFSNNVFNEQVKVINSNYQESLTLTSKLLTDAEYVWLRELMTSPLVYVEIGGYLYPTKITGTDYEQRKRVTDKLTSIQITVDILDKHNSQHR